MGHLTTHDTASPDGPPVDVTSIEVMHLHHLMTSPVRLARRVDGRRRQVFRMEHLHDTPGSNRPPVDG